MTGTQQQMARSKEKATDNGCHAANADNFVSASLVERHPLNIWESIRSSVVCPHPFRGAPMGHRTRQRKNEFQKSVLFGSDRPATAARSRVTPERGPRGVRPDRWPIGGGAYHKTCPIPPTQKVTARARRGPHSPGGTYSKGRFPRPPPPPPCVTFRPVVGALDGHPHGSHYPQKSPDSSSFHIPSPHPSLGSPRSSVREGTQGQPYPPPPPVGHAVGLLSLYGALDSHPFVPSHVASGRCVLSAAAAGAPAGVVSALAEGLCWCAPRPPPPKGAQKTRDMKQNEANRGTYESRKDPNTACGDACSALPRAMLCAPLRPARPPARPAPPRPARPTPLWFWGV